MAVSWGSRSRSRAVGWPIDSMKRLSAMSCSKRKHRGTVRGATSAAPAMSATVVARRPRSLRPPAGAETEADFLEVRRPGVDAYPTLLLHTAHGADRPGGPVAAADALTHALDQHVAATTAA